MRRCLLFLFMTAMFFGCAAGQRTVSLVQQNDDEQDLSTMPLGIYLNVMDYENGILQVKLINVSGYTMTYGNEYWLQKKTDTGYINVEPQKEYAWDEVSYEIEDMREVTLSYDLSVFGDLEAGEYRLCKTDLSADFELE